MNPALPLMTMVKAQTLSLYSLQAEEVMPHPDSSLRSQ